MLWHFRAENHCSAVWLPLTVRVNVVSQSVCVCVLSAGRDPGPSQLPWTHRHHVIPWTKHQIPKTILTFFQRFVVCFHWFAFTIHPSAIASPASGHYLYWFISRVLMVYLHLGICLLPFLCIVFAKVELLLPKWKSSRVSGHLERSQVTHPEPGTFCAALPEISSLLESPQVHITHVGTVAFVVCWCMWSWRWGCHPLIAT